MFLSAVITIGLSMGLYGYDNSFAAPLMALPLFIARYQGPALSFTVSQEGSAASSILMGGFKARNLNLIVPVPLIGAAIGVFIASPLMKRIGRKKTFLVAYFLLCIPGSFLQLFAPNIGALVVGRFWNCKNISRLPASEDFKLKVT